MEKKTPTTFQTIIFPALIFSVMCFHKLILNSAQDKANPLEVSPANQEVSQQREPTEGGAENSSASSESTSDEHQPSGGGKTLKGKKVS